MFSTKAAREEESGGNKDDGSNDGPQEQRPGPNFQTVPGPRD